jgi:beta-N-acetylglucosaminidase
MENNQTMKASELRKIKDVNSNNKIRRAELRIKFLESNKQTERSINEIEKLKDKIEVQKGIVKKRNDYYNLV